MSEDVRDHRGRRPGRLGYVAQCLVVCSARYLAVTVILTCLLAGPSRALEDVEARSIDKAREPVASEFSGLDDPGIRELWREGNELEQAGDLLASNDRYRMIAERLGSSAVPYWRMARNYWNHHISLPKEDKEQQILFLELAGRAADRGLEIDDSCAKCILWKYAALGRLPTIRGLLSAAGDAKTLARLLERGIELSSADGEDPSNETLAAFYNASASFYRMVPDWFWLRWVFGVQGNKQRALRDARQAVSLSASRLEYQVELGAALLCIGKTKRKPERTAEGLRFLREVIGHTSTPSADPLDRELAEMLIQSPEQACSFSRLGFIDVDSAAKVQKD